MEDTIKTICCGLVVMAALYIILTVLPYVVVFLAVCGVWYLFQEYNKPR
jgi:hypothetical protein